MTDYRTNVEYRGIEVTEAFESQEPILPTRTQRYTSSSTNDFGIFICSYPGMDDVGIHWDSIKDGAGVRLTFEQASILRDHLIAVLED